MIKVVNICSDTNIGGAGRCILTFLKHYDRSKFDVSVILPPESKLSDAVRALDTQVIEGHGLQDKSMSLPAVRSLRGILKEIKPDIVHTHGAMSGRIAAKICRCGIVYTRHSVFPVSGRLSKNPGKWINGHVNEFFADAIIAVAEAAKENLVDSGVSPEKIAVILNGVEQQPRITQARYNELRGSYGIDDGCFTAGIIARLEDIKGHRFLIEAVQELRSEGRNIKVLIAGVGGNAEALKHLTVDMGLGDSVVFTGFLDKVYEVLGILDVQINASYGTEATSLALLEGMSMGLPAIVSDYGGNPGVITHGKNGLIFPSEDSGALADCMREVMDDNALLKRLSGGAKEVYEKKFTAVRYTRDIEDLYKIIYMKRGRYNG